MVVVDEPQVHAALAGRRDDLGRPPGHPDRARCRRTCSCSDLDAGPAQRARPARRRTGGCAARSSAARRGRGRRRTSTRPRPAAPARCRCWTSPCRGGCAARGSAARAGTPAGPPVDRDADQAAGQVPLEPGAHGHEAGVRAAVEQRHAEALGRADDDVGAHRARRLQQRQREQVGGHDGHARRASCAASISGRGSRTRAVGAGVLHQHAARVRDVVGQPVGQVGDDAPRCPSRAARVSDDRDGLRQRVGVDDERSGRPSCCARRTSVIASAAAVPSSSSEALAVGSPVRSPTMRLEVEQRLEPALGDLRLVRRVGGVPGRVLQHVASYDGRGDRAVVAQADHRLAGCVAGRELAQLARPPAARWRPAAGRARRRRGCRRGRRRPSARRGSRSRGPPASWRRSSVRGPMCRSANAPAVSRSARLGWSDTEAPGDVAVRSPPPLSATRRRRSRVACPRGPGA